MPRPDESSAVGGSRGRRTVRRERRSWLYVVLGLIVTVGVVTIAISVLGNKSEASAETVAVAPPIDGAHLVSKPSTSATATKKKKDKTVGYAPPASRPRPRSTSNAEPIAATVFVKAENVPAYPPDGRHGRRIVYSKALMHVWIVDDNDRVVRHYPVIGRWDRPAKGVYHVYSTSRDTMNTHSKVVFSYMVRFAWGKEDAETSIGFHSIPIHYADISKWNVKKGDPVSLPSEMGLPIAEGGCVRAVDDNARFLYFWSKVGDTVVVLPTGA